MKKKIIVCILAAMLCLSAAGCGKSAPTLSDVPAQTTAMTTETTLATTVPTTVATTTTATKKPTQKQTKKTTAKKVVAPKITTAPKKNVTVAPEKTRPVSNADKQFLKDYENWVDRYLVLADKIVADPENPDLADQFYDMMAEADTWVARLEEISEVLVEGSEQTKQFEAEVVRISKKLEDGVNKILASTTVAPTAAPTTAAVTVNATEAA